MESIEDEDKLSSLSVEELIGELKLRERIIEYNDDYLEKELRPVEFEVASFYNRFKSDQEAEAAHKKKTRWEKSITVFARWSRREVQKGKSSEEIQPSKTEGDWKETQTRYHNRWSHEEYRRNRRAWGEEEKGRNADYRVDLID